MTDDSLVIARVESITPLTNSILQLFLAPEPYVEYKAGQYLQVVLNHETYCYSIANAPLGSHKYELHIRHSLDNPYNQALLKDIRKRGVVTLRVPLGDCHMDKLNAQKPIIFIAGGTGFAPIKAMIEQLLADGAPRIFELYWGARSQCDLYLEEQVEHWQTHVPQFRYFSHVSEIKNASLMTTCLKRHESDLTDWQMVVSGPFDMVYTTRDALVELGVASQDIFSDAFSFEKKT